MKKIKELEPRVCTKTEKNYVRKRTDYIHLTVRKKRQINAENAGEEEQGRERNREEERKRKE